MNNMNKNKIEIELDKFRQLKDMRSNIAVDTAIVDDKTLGVINN